MRRILAMLFGLWVWLVCVSRLPAATYYHYPQPGVETAPTGGWPVVWTPVLGLDADVVTDAGEHVDFVGDSTDPCAYWAHSEEYLFFRARVDFPGPVGPGTFSDSHFVYIDIVGFGNEDGKPDHVFVWDSNQALAEHGVKLGVPAGPWGTWAAAQMDDADGDNAVKISPPDPDFAGDAIVRTEDGVATANFGNSTFIDFAISWDYMTRLWDHDNDPMTPDVPITNLSEGQSWRIAFGAKPNAGGNASLGPDGDVVAVNGLGGAISLGGPGWSGVITTADTGAGQGAAAVVDLYRAYINTFDKRTILDTCRARNMSEARAVFESRHVGARIGSVTYIRDALASGYRLFLGGVRTADARNIKDTCWAQNPALARKIIGARYPDGAVNHMGLYPTNRDAVTYYAVAQRADTFDTLVAENLKDAFGAFTERFPRERIVRVVQIGNENALQTFEGLVDPGEVTEVVQAASPDAAAAAAVAKRPGFRVLKVQRGRSADGITTYEARVSTGQGRTIRDNCSARFVSEAQRILRNRHGTGSSVAVEEIRWDEGYELFDAKISSAGEQGFADATFAKTAAAARDILRARYASGTVASVSRAGEGRGYREFQGRVNTTDGRNVMDTCWATSPATARKVFSARFPGAAIRSVSRFGTGSADTFEVVLKGQPRRERCEARDKAEAYRILAMRHADGRVVTVQPVAEVPQQSVFKAALNTPDSRNVIDTIQANSYSAARTLLLARHPGSRFTSLHRVTDGPVSASFQAQIDLPPARDTVEAYSPAEAMSILRARYPRSGIGGLRVILAAGL